MLSIVLFLMIFCFFSWGIYGKNENEVIEIVDYGIKENFEIKKVEKKIDKIEKIEKIKYILEDEDMIIDCMKKLEKLSIRELYELSKGKIKSYKKLKKWELINKLSEIWEELDI
jgi:hypothetical protein